MRKQRTKKAGANRRIGNRATRNSRLQWFETSTESSTRRKRPYTRSRTFLPRTWSDLLKAIRNANNRNCILKMSHHANPEVRQTISDLQSTRCVTTNLNCSSFLTAICRETERRQKNWKLSTSGIIYINFCVQYNSCLSVCVVVVSITDASANDD